MTYNKQANIVSGNLRAELEQQKIPKIFYSYCSTRILSKKLMLAENNSLSCKSEKTCGREYIGESK